MSQTCAGVRRLKMTFMRLNLKNLAVGGGLAAALVWFAANSNTCADSAKAAPGPAPVGSATHLTPGPLDGTIANVVAQLLIRNHYSQHPFDDVMSEKFYYHYLEAL